MTMLASPAKAFLQTHWSTSAIRRVHLAASSPASTPRHHPRNYVARQTSITPRTARRSLVSLCAGTDGAKDAAMAAVQAAEEALSKAAEEAGMSGMAPGAGQVQLTVAAARAAARNAMESLRRDEPGFGGGFDGEGGRDVFARRQVGCVFGG